MIQDGQEAVGVPNDGRDHNAVKRFKEVGLKHHKIGRVPSRTL